MTDNATSLEVVTREVDGRTLSGVTADPAQLERTMARFAKAAPKDPPPVVESPEAAPPTQEQTPAAPAGAPLAEGAAESPEKAPRGKKRFDQLTFEKGEAERAAKAAEDRAAALEARLAALEQQRQTPAAQPPAAPAPQPPSLPAHLKSYDAYLAQHPDSDYESYRDARDDWRREHLVAPQFDAQIRSRIEADRASRTVADHIADTRAKGRTMYPDFDAVLAGPGAQIPFTADRLMAILEHPASPHLQYVIAKDLALAQKLATCSPFAFGAELVRLTPAASGAPAASPGSPGSVTPPSPMQPVGSGSKTTTPSSADLASKGYDFDQSGYRERRAAERGVTRRR